MTMWKTNMTATVSIVCRTLSRHLLQRPSLHSHTVLLTTAVRRPCVLAVAVSTSSSNVAMVTSRVTMATHRSRSHVWIRGFSTKVKGTSSIHNTEKIERTSNNTEDGVERTSTEDRAERISTENRAERISTEDRAERISTEDRAERTSTEDRAERTNIEDGIEASEIEDLMTASEKLEQLDAEMKRKLKVIQMEWQLSLQMEKLVPKNISDEQSLELLQCDSEMQREQRLYYFWVKECRQLKREKRKLYALLNKKSDEEFEKEKYRTLIFYPPKSTRRIIRNARMATAMLYAPRIVYDIRYESVMDKRECSDTAQQLFYSHEDNRKHVNPLHMVIANALPNSSILSKWQFIVQEFKLNIEILTITEKSYLDLFPKNRLVYLTKNSQHELHRLAPNDIYIVGGFVDKKVPKPLSYAYARKEGIRTARLPLDRYLHWQKGKKNLTLYLMMKIMLDMYDTGDWKQAFKHIPSRYLTPQVPNTKDQYLTKMGNKNRFN